MKSSVVSDPRRTGEPLLALHEIQGNVLPGFNKPFQVFLFLRCSFTEACKEWLYTVGRRLTSAADVFEYRASRKRNNVVPAVCWTNLAVSFEALRELCHDADSINDVGFRHGPSRLWRESGGGSEAGVSNWMLGGPGRRADVLILFGHDDAHKLGQIVRQVIDSMPTCMAVVHVDRGSKLPGGREHFGYRDAISEPVLRGRVPAGHELLHPTEADANAGEGAPGKALSWPGELVFGYPESHPLDELAPGDTAVGGPSWMKNGSFMAYLRIRQNVAPFHRCCAELSRKARMVDRSLRWATPEAIAARLMGRWASGAPVTMAPTEDDPSLGHDERRNNRFSYFSRTESADASGRRCPFFAHIRKMNPRDTPGVHAHRHRIFRRGIPFGPPPPVDEERGLLFVSYHTSFDRQLEFVLRHWAANSNFPVSGSGVDPLFARAETAKQRISIHLDASGRQHAISTLLAEPFVTMTGGEYLFSPSLSCVKQVFS